MADQAAQAADLVLEAAQEVLVVADSVLEEAGHLLQEVTTDMMTIITIIVHADQEDLGTFQCLEGPLLFQQALVQSFHF